MKNTKKSATRITLSALILTASFTALGGCASFTAESKPVESEVAEEARAEVTLAAYRSIDDYFKMPDIDFSVHYKPEPVRGIYVSGPRAGGVREDGTKYLDDLITIVNNTPANAMVIDIKNEHKDYNVTVKGKIQAADDMGISNPLIPQPEEVMEKLAQNNIYPIARVVAFKDNALRDTNPEFYVKDDAGEIYYDNGGSAWLNPYNRDTWEYNIAIAKGAAALGFKEIQFDYIRFVADDDLDDETNFGDTGGKSKEEIILDFARYAVEELHPLGVKVSADVYGTVIGSPLDAGIVGQNYVELSKILDVICPMVYPSHYALGEFGVAQPDFDPHTIILKSMQLSTEKLSVIPEGEHVAIVRPWLQDFTASYLATGYQTYGEKQRDEQIKAAYEADINEWILWDAGVNYDGAGWGE